VADAPLRLFVDRLDSPLGELLLIFDATEQLRAADWADHESRLLRLLQLRYGTTRFDRRRTVLTRSLRAYFRGDLGAIDALPVAMSGTTFQERVWTALRGIACGTVTSYAALAARIGRPTAIRAVGLANGGNPVSIVVPCHRVIGSNGRLTGYGGGLHRKRWLLAHENVAVS
jgi:methylated-DNA-[protein]-cysteine S-methyltransferase